MLPFFLQTLPCLFIKFLPLQSTYFCLPSFAVPLRPVIRTHVPETLFFSLYLSIFVLVSSFYLSLTSNSQTILCLYYAICYLLFKDEILFTFLSQFFNFRIFSCFSFHLFVPLFDSCYLSCYSVGMIPCTNYTFNLYQQHSLLPAVI